MQSGPRLADPPVRTSRQFDEASAVRTDALIKLRLGHSANGSVLIPEQLFIERSGWSFYQTNFFGPPILGFNIEPALHEARFSLDIGGPSTFQPTRVIAKIRSDALVRRYDDGAQLYRCVIDGPPDLADHPSGQARPLEDGDFALKLFHITNTSGAEGIAKSNEIWSSPWNLQGTRKLTNVAYVYLTSLPEIRDEMDLRRIAMSSDGEICFQTTSSRHREQVLAMTVYRENTTGRTHSLPVEVPSMLIAPPHLLLHRTTYDAYYEVIGPEIYRIGVSPGVSLSYREGRGSVSEGSSKNFSYIIVGDAAELDGLAAPYHEEGTQYLMHAEILDRHDLFEFWQANSNSDQMTGRTFEARSLE